MRRLVPELAELDPSLDICLFHARFEGRHPPDRLTRTFWTEELPQGIRTLYPGWSAVGEAEAP